jgi:hypothetical protein
MSKTKPKAGAALLKQLKPLYSPSAKTPVLIDVAKMNFAMIDGAGGPEGVEFQQAVEALYGVCFTLKFMHKKGHPARETKVMALEGLWWMKGGEEFDMNRREDWMWTAMIMQPDFITQEMTAKATEELRRKKNPPALAKVRFEAFHEGLSVQIMHVGPYSAERPTIERLLKFAEENGYRVRGKHHEIYLGDPRRTKPERLKTVIRYPIEKK